MGLETIQKIVELLRCSEQIWLELASEQLSLEDREPLRQRLAEATRDGVEILARAAPVWNDPCRWLRSRNQ